MRLQAGTHSHCVDKSERYYRTCSQEITKHHKAMICPEPIWKGGPRDFRPGEGCFAITSPKQGIPKIAAIPDRYCPPRFGPLPTGPALPANLLSYSSDRLLERPCPHLFDVIGSVSDAGSWWWPGDRLSCCMVLLGCVGGACDWILDLRFFPWMLADASEGYERMVRREFVS